MWQEAFKPRKESSRKKAWDGYVKYALLKAHRLFCGRITTVFSSIAIMLIGRSSGVVLVISATAGLQYVTGLLSEVLAKRLW